MKLGVESLRPISPVGPVFFCQVVVKTKADYDAESKKGKLRSPKIAEFSISIIEGVSERLKVRIMTSSASFWSPSHTPHTAHMRTKPERETGEDAGPLGSSGRLSPPLLHVSPRPPPPPPLQNPRPCCSSEPPSSHCASCARLLTHQGHSGRHKAEMIHLTPP